MNNPHPPIPFTDHNGDACYRVPLGRNGQPHVTILAEDYEYLLSLGISETWTHFSDGKGRWYVSVFSCSTNGSECKNIPIARLLMGAGPREAVHYVNGDSKDLRRSNLRVQKGAGRYDGIEWVEGSAQKGAPSEVEDATPALN